MHARSALGAFVANHHHVAGRDLVAQDGFHGFVLAFKHARLARELPDGFVDASGLHDAALFGHVAVQHGQTAIFGIGVFLIANAALVAIDIQGVETPILAECLLRGNATRRRGIEGAHREILAGRRVPLGNGIAQGLGVHSRHLAMDEPGAVELGQDTEHATRAMHVLDVVLGGGGRDFAQTGHPARNLVDVGHGELHLGLLGAGK